MSHFENRSLVSVSRRLSTILFAVALAVGLVAITGSAASADYDTVTTITPSNPAAYSNRADDVSCVSATFCMSVLEGRESSSFSDPAETFLTKWDGGSWSLVVTSGWPSGFRANDIACATTSFCFVSGGVSAFDQATQSVVNTAYLMLWNGSSVSQVSLPSGISMLSAVSCASATFCLIVGGSSETPQRSLVLRWDGSSLTRESSSNFTNGTNGQFMIDVDCDTSRRCVGITSIDLGSGTYSGEILDRGAVAGMWSRLTGRTDSLGQLQSVDCQPGELGRCAIVGAVSGGTSGVLYDLGADMSNKFTNIAFPILPAGFLTNGLTGRKMTCVSTTRCLLAGYFMVDMPKTESYVAVWNGSTWNRLDSASGAGGAGIDDISCPTANQCVSVGQSKATSGMMAPSSAAGWFIRDAGLVQAPSATAATTTTTAATNTTTAALAATTTTTATITTTTAPAATTTSTVASNTATTAAPIRNTTAAAPASNQSVLTTTTLPAPALAVVKNLPKAPTPIIANTSISNGQVITVSFGGFAPLEYVQLIVASNPKVIGSGYANSQGVVTISGNLPANLASGGHTLAVYAPASGVGFAQPITVAQTTLPKTGGNDQLLLLALTLLLSGFLIRRSPEIQELLANRH